MKNPFLTSGYESPSLFCDRKKETIYLYNELTNGNNVVLMSPRKMGKTGLINHCISTCGLEKEYNIFVLDIYAAKNLHDFTTSLANTVARKLFRVNRIGYDIFAGIVTGASLLWTSGEFGGPDIALRLHPSRTDHTLEQVFEYFRKSKKPCILAIDEFQQIAGFPEKNTEAQLRTLIQQTPNLRCVFAGSSRHLLGEMFCSPLRPFYQSASMLHLGPIEEGEYIAFAQQKFSENGKRITPDAVSKAYKYAGGTTWYVQKLLNTAFSLTEKFSRDGDECSEDTIDDALNEILGSLSYTYEELLYRLPIKQKELLTAISKEGKVIAPQSEEFTREHSLTASSVQSAKKGLLEKDLIIDVRGSLSVNDRFLEIWLNRDR